MCFFIPCDFVLTSLLAFPVFLGATQWCEVPFLAAAAAAAAAAAGPAPAAARAYPAFVAVAESDLRHVQEFAQDSPCADRT